MQRIVIAGLLLAAVLALPACAKRETPDSSASGTGAPSSADATPPTSAPDGAAAALAAVEVERLVGAKTVFAEAGLQEADAGKTEAIATVQVALGAKADEAGVFAVIAEMAQADSKTPVVRVEVWTPGEPDARFAQYLWDRGNGRLERFEASIPASEFEAYAPMGDEDAKADPQGFEAGRTGVMDGVDLAKLQALAAGAAPVWDSETP